MRSRMDSEDADDCPPDGIGYGRPPLHTRFKPGQSGNPKGRPKNRKNISTVLREVLNENIKIKEGDKIKTVSKAEAMVRGTVLKALKGDTKSVMMVMELDEKIQQEQKSLPVRVVRMPPEVKDTDEWFERYAPKEIAEERLRRKKDGTDAILMLHPFSDKPVKPPSLSPVAGRPEHSEKGPAGGGAQ